MSLYNDDTILPLRIRTPPPDNEEDDRVYKKAIEGLSRASNRRTHFTFILWILLMIGIGCAIHLMSGSYLETGDYTPIVLFCLFIFAVCYFSSDIEFPSRYDPV